MDTDLFGMLLFEPDGGEGDDGGTGDGDGDGDGAGDDEALTPEEAKALREENAALKASAAKAKTEAARKAKAEADAKRQKAQEEGDAATLQKELDKEKARADAAEAALIRNGARAIATELGAVDPATVVTLLDWDSIGDPTNEAEVKQAIRALLKDKPYLRKQTEKTGAGEGGTGNVAGTMNDIIRSAAGRK